MILNNNKKNQHVNILSAYYINIISYFCLWFCHAAALTALRGVYDLFRIDDNIHCRKDSPCSARGKASCIHSRIACAFARLRRPKAPPRVTFLPFSPPQDAGFLPAGKGTRSSLRPLRRKSGKFSALFCSSVMKGVIDYKKKFL